MSEICRELTESEKAELDALRAENERLRGLIESHNAKIPNPCCLVASPDNDHCGDCPHEWRIELPEEPAKARYPRCTKALRAEGKPYPRTCQECGLGPCKNNLPDELAKAQGGG